MEFWIFILVVLSILTWISVLKAGRRQKRLDGKVDGLITEMRRIRDSERAVPGVSLAPEPAPAPTSPAKVAVDKPDAQLTARAPSDVEAPVTPPPLPAAVPKPAPVPPRVPKPPSRFVETTRSALAKMWNWFLVNEEHRPEGVTAEYAIASVWTLRIGILALVGCIVFFLRWSIEEGLITDQGRVAISIFAGIGMILAGLRMFGKKYHVIGQGPGHVFLMHETLLDGVDGDYAKQAILCIDHWEVNGICIAKRIQDPLERQRFKHGGG